MFGNLFIELLAMLGSLIVATLIVFALAVFTILFVSCLKGLKAVFKNEKKKEENENGVS